MNIIILSAACSYEYDARVHQPFGSLHKTFGYAFIAFKQCSVKIGCYKSYHAFLRSLFSLLRGGSYVRLTRSLNYNLYHVKNQLSR